MDKDRNYIVRVDLSKELRKPFSEGPKYCENRITGYHISKGSIITKISHVFNIDVTNMVFLHYHFLNGKHLWYQQLTKKRSFDESNKSRNKLKVKNETINKELKMLHNKFVFVSIDNANGNVDFVWKGAIFKFWWMSLNGTKSITSHLNSLKKLKVHPTFSMTFKQIPFNKTEFILFKKEF